MKKKNLIIVIIFIILIIFCILSYFLFKDMNSKYIINKGGEYTLEGNINKSVIINTDDEVKIILNNVNIKSKNGPAIYVKNALKVELYLADNSTNNLEDSIKYSDDDINGCVFSNAALTINGNGTLNVVSNYKNGIKVENINESLIINGGVINVDSKTNGLNSSNDIIINNGEININAGSYDELPNDLLELSEWKDYSEFSGKGIKADNDITINGGTLNIKSIDDAIHSNNNITINDGEIVINTGDDGVHSDNILTINSCNLNVNFSFEGLESKLIKINDGTIVVKAYDDAINAKSKEYFSVDELIEINGGNISIYTKGDGIDSNRDIVINDGDIYVDSPAANGFGSFDYNNTLKVLSGNIIGNQPKEVVFNTKISLDSLVNNMLLSFDNTIKNSDTVKILNKNGDIIFKYNSDNAYDALVAISEKFKINEVYYIYINDDKVSEAKITELNNKILVNN